MFLLGKTLLSFFLLFAAFYSSSIFSTLSSNKPKILFNFCSIVFLLYNLILGGEKIYVIFKTKIIGSIGSKSKRVPRFIPTQRSLWQGNGARQRYVPRYALVHRWNLRWKTIAFLRKFRNRCFELFRVRRNSSLGYSSCKSNLLRHCKFRIRHKTRSMDHFLRFFKFVAGPFRVF